MLTPFSFKKAALSACMVLLIATASYAQQRGQQVREIKKERYDDPVWRKENYIINRDSAYSNPYFALQKLRWGNQRFTEGRSIHPRQDAQVINELANGQKPFATIVGCSDSRVSAEILFDQGFGDLFVTRTAGQVMAQASYGTIEFASAALGTKLILVLGHSKCGAVDAAISLPENPPGHIVTLINSIKPATKRYFGVSDNLLDFAIRQNVINQVNELRELEPVLSRMYQRGEILIVGAVYDLATGKVEFLEETMIDLPPTKFSKREIMGM
jgi:carbonic anhydrase